MGGNAVKMAASRIKDHLFVIAGRILGAPPTGLEARNGKIFVKRNDKVSMPWDEVARIAFSEGGPVVGTGYYEPPRLGGDYKGAAVGTSPAYSFGTIVMEVDVDLETGQVKVVECTDYHDAGQIVNPCTAHGQVHGAVVMSIGEVMMENVLFDEKGRAVNPNLHEYLIPTAMETPKMKSDFVDSYEPRGPFGAKEIGEGSTLPIMGALANAIYDATGVRVYELPITSEKVLKGLKEKGDR
jgi:4-hydroxybenzoyl-CoA reductase subunit alpha